MIDRPLRIDQGHEQRPAGGADRKGDQPAGLGRQWWLALSLLLLPWLITLVCWRQLVARQPWAGLTLLPGLAAATLLLAHLRRHVGRNHPPGEAGRPFATLGAANWVTLLRGSACVALAGFFPLALAAANRPHGPLAWAPGSIYLFMAMADLLDGLLARRSGRVTELGKSLDMTTDAAGLLIASLLAVAQERLPAPYLLVGIAYYPFRAGDWLRQRRGLPVTPLTSRPYSRIIAGVQMALVGVALLPLVARPYLTIAAYLGMTPFLLGFLRDWLVVSCRLQTDSQQGTIWDRWAAELWTRVLPPLLRLFLLGAVSLGGLSQTSLIPPAPWRFSAAVCAVLAGIGLLGRLAGLAMALIIAIPLASAEPGHHTLTLFGAAFTLALTGSGPCSLWSPEESLLYR